MERKESNNEKALLTTALREIRALNRTVTELSAKIAQLSAGHTRRVSISEYSQANGISNRCVRERIFKGVLNAEKIGGKYYITLPA
jgi:hypothetical protein